MDQPIGFRPTGPQDGGGIHHFRIRYELYQFSFSGNKAAWRQKEIDLGEITLKEAIEEFKKAIGVQQLQFSTRVRNFGLFRLDKIDLD